MDQKSRWDGSHPAGVFVVQVVTGLNEEQEQSLSLVLIEQLWGE